jgi:hypothetical protein
MPARTFSTDVYLTPAPAPTVKAVRSASRCASFRVSRLPSPACEQVVHQLVSGTRKPEIARPSQVAHPIGKALRALGCP